MVQKQPQLYIQRPRDLQQANQPIAESKNEQCKDAGPQLESTDSGSQGKQIAKQIQKKGMYKGQNSDSQPYKLISDKKITNMPNPNLGGGASNAHDSPANNFSINGKENCASN